MGTPEYMAPEQAAGRRRRPPQRHLFGRRAAVRDGDRAAAAEARGRHDAAARRCACSCRRRWTASSCARWRRSRTSVTRSMAQLEYDLAKTLFGRTRARLRPAGAAATGGAPRRRGGAERDAGRADAAARGVAGGRAARAARCPAGVAHRDAAATDAAAAARSRLWRRRRWRGHDAGGDPAARAAQLSRGRAGAADAHRHARAAGAAPWGRSLPGDRRGAGPGGRRRCSHLPPAAVDLARADRARCRGGTAPPVNAPTVAAQPGSAAEPAPSEAESKAARGRAATADVERLLASGVGFDKRAALDDGLRRMRAAGADAEADKLAARAKAALIKAAEAELDSGELDAGVAHYKAAARLAPRRIGYGVAVGSDPPARAGGAGSASGRRGGGAAGAAGAVGGGRSGAGARAAGRHAVRGARVRGVGRPNIARRSPGRPTTRPSSAGWTARARSWGRARRRRRRLRRGDEDEGARRRGRRGGFARGRKAADAETASPPSEPAAE